MEPFVIPAICLFVVLILLALLKTVGKSAQGRRLAPADQSLEYQSLNHLLSPAERSFYGVLLHATQNTGVVFCKVRVADVMTPAKSLSRPQWQRAFNSIAAKHFDFLVCDPRDCSIQFAIELDDSSHNSTKSQKRDEFLEGACRSAGLPLVRIKASNNYTVNLVQTQIDQTINPVGELQPPEVESRILTPTATAASVRTSTLSQTSETPAQAVPDATIPQGASVSETSFARVCPKCGKPMLRRTAKSGPNAGEEFWGCSAFPRCRTVESIGA